MTFFKFWVGLGSNIGNRNSFLTKAGDKLQDISSTPIVKSSIYETPPWGGVAKDPFLNQVIELGVTADDLEMWLQNLETEFNHNHLTVHSEWLSDRLRLLFSKESSNLSSENRAAEIFMFYLLYVEVILGRDRSTTAIRWDSRIIDLDLLEMSPRTETYHSLTLTLPHPRLSERQFVLMPWAEIAPQFHLNTHNVNVATLQTNCPPDLNIRLWNP